MLRIGMMTETIYRYVGMKRALKLMKDIGFECADITFQVEGHADIMVDYFKGKDYKKNALALKKYADKIKLPLVQAHATFPSIRIDNIAYNRQEWKNILRCIEVCGILKVKHLVVHPINDFTDEENIKFFKKLIPYAKKANVIICGENLWRFDKKEDHAKVCACSLARSFNAIIDGVDSKYFKACIDIGHAEMMRFMNYSSYKILTEMKERVACLHIHDNDLRHDLHQIPFTNKINYQEVIKGLKKINYQGDLIAEILLNDVVDFKKRVKLYKKNYEAMKKFRRMMK